MLLDGLFFHQIWRNGVKAVDTPQPLEFSAGFVVVTEDGRTKISAPAVDEATQVIAPADPADNGKVYVASAGQVVPSSELIVSAGNPAIGNAKRFQGKLVGGTAVSLIGVDTNDDLVVGQNTTSAIYLAFDEHDFRANNVSVLELTENASYISAAGAIQLEINSGTIDCKDNQIKTTGFISLGAAPAGDGAVRGSAGFAVRAKTTGGTDLDVVTTSDTLTVFGDDNVGDTTILRAPTTVRVNVGAVVELEVTDGLVDAKNNEIRTGGFISIGASPATQGGLRLANGTDGAIYFRNFVGDASYLGLRLSSAGNVLDLGDALIPTTRALASTVFRVTIGATNELEVSAGLVDCKDNQIATSGYLRVSGSGYAAIGAAATVPSTGLLRLQQNVGGIQYRNAAGTNNLAALDVNATDHVVVGDDDADCKGVVAKAEYGVSVSVTHEASALVTALADAASTAPEFTLPEDGHYSFTAKALVKRATSLDYREIGVIVSAVRDGASLTFLGDPVDIPGGDSTGLTLALSVSESDLLVTLTNGTGEVVNGRILVGWMKQDLI